MPPCPRDPASDPGEARALHLGSPFCPQSHLSHCHMGTISPESSLKTTPQVSDSCTVSWTESSGGASASQGGREAQPGGAGQGHSARADPPTDAGSHHSFEQLLCCLALEWVP